MPIFSLLLAVALCTHPAAEGQQPGRSGQGSSSSGGQSGGAPNSGGQSGQSQSRGAQIQSSQQSSAANRQSATGNQIRSRSARGQQSLGSQLDGQISGGQQQVGRANSGPQSFSQNGNASRGNMFQGDSPQGNQRRNNDSMSREFSNNALQFDANGDGQLAANELTNLFLVLASTLKQDQDDFYNNMNGSGRPQNGQNNSSVTVRTTTNQVTTNSTTSNLLSPGVSPRFAQRQDMRQAVFVFLTLAMQFDANGDGLLSQVELLQLAAALIANDMNFLNATTGRSVAQSGNRQSQQQTTSVTTTTRQTTRMRADDPARFGEQYSQGRDDDGRAGRGNNNINQGGQRGPQFSQSRGGQMGGQTGGTQTGFRSAQSTSTGPGNAASVNSGSRNSAATGSSGQPARPR